MMQRVSRRGLLGKGAAGAAAVAAVTALPTVAQADELVHDAECFHRKFSAPDENIEARDHAWNNLMATATPEQRRWLFDLDTEYISARVNEQDRFIAEVCRHFPGLAPAIRAVAYHLEEQLLADVGVCCSE